MTTATIQIYEARKDGLLMLDRQTKFTGFETSIQSWIEGQLAQCRATGRFAILLPRYAATRAEVEAAEYRMQRHLEPVEMDARPWDADLVR